mmetsp:Transcript_18657/g.46780  ORF Transcript_18657/g.46780 Transcript_18657/m.46780 type:complete len:300 (-) Transcript_18657:449-1348(-)
MMLHTFVNARRDISAPTSFSCSALGRPLSAHERRHRGSSGCNVMYSWWRWRSPSSACNPAPLNTYICAVPSTYASTKRSRESSTPCSAYVFKMRLMNSSSCAVRKSGGRKWKFHAHSCPTLLRHACCQSKRPNSSAPPTVRQKYALSSIRSLCPKATMLSSSQSERMIVGMSRMISNSRPTSSCGGFHVMKAGLTRRPFRVHLVEWCSPVSPVNWINVHNRAWVSSKRGVSRLRTDSRPDQNCALSFAPATMNACCSSSEITSRIRCLSGSTDPATAWAPRAANCTTSDRRTNSPLLGL